jgi:hypothetical protein
MLRVLRLYLLLRAVCVQFAERCCSPGDLQSFPHGMAYVCVVFWDVHHAVVWSVPLLHGHMALPCNGAMVRL